MRDPAKMSVTEKVIHEQFPFWQNALDLELPAIPKGAMVFIGCGTSFYLAQSLAAVFNLSGRSAYAVPGAEWLSWSRAYVSDRSDLCIVGLSRSGESTETVRAVRAAREAGLATMALTCAPGSSITEAAEIPVVADTHADEGVVMTSSASLMLLMGLRLAGVEVTEAEVTEAKRLLGDVVARGRDMIAGRSHFVYLGAGPNYGIATEGALKLMEMSLSYSQSFHPLEYRHGPVSLVDEKTLVILLYSDESREDEERVAADVQKKGARVIGFGGAGDFSLDVKTTGPARTLVMLPALQLLGEEVALDREIDTTAPRHLTKVVMIA